MTTAGIKSRKNRWIKLGLTFLFFILISVGIGYLIQSLIAQYNIPKDVPEWVAFCIIFGLLALINATIVPLPFGVSIMLAAAMHWNPVLVALFGSLGACLGEFNGYFFGYLGKRIAIDEITPGYEMVHRWIKKYGMWAIAFLSFQPVIPFEIGGFIAGVARMPLRLFLPALWLGKFPKYVALIYLGTALFRFIPGLK